ncbi:hypothetical protein MCETHM1_03627 [Flavobacteriaceae bacterium]
MYDPTKRIVASQKVKEGKFPKPELTAKEDTYATCTYLGWIYEDGHFEVIEELYCTGGGSGGGVDGNTGGYGGGSTSGTSTNTPVIDYSVKNPCDKIKKLKEDPNYKNAVVELMKNFKIQYETGYYISKSNGYEDGFPDGNLKLTGTIYSDTYGIIHVHEDSFEHQVDNGGIRAETVDIIPMFSPGDVDTFSSLLLTANKYKTSSLDEVFVEMVSSSGRYQLRFEGNINNVKNFDYESLKDTYKEKMNLYSNDLETGLLMFIKDYIGIEGITLFKMNEKGSTERKTLSSPNVLESNPCK